MIRRPRLLPLGLEFINDCFAALGTWPLRIRLQCTGSSPCGPRAVPVCGGRLEEYGFRGGPADPLSGLPATPLPRRCRPGLLDLGVGDAVEVIDDLGVGKRLDPVQALRWEGLDKLDPGRDAAPPGCPRTSRVPDRRRAVFCPRVGRSKDPSKDQEPQGRARRAEAPRQRLPRDGLQERPDGEHHPGDRPARGPPSGAERRANEAGLAPGGQAGLRHDLARSEKRPPALVRWGQDLEAGQRRPFPVVHERRDR